MKSGLKNTAASVLKGDNIILDKLPESVKIGGKEYRIYSDFRTSILFETMMRNGSLKGWEKLKQMLSLYYPVIPPNHQEAIRMALWFYNCGKDPEKQEKEKNKTRAEFRKDRVSYSFDQDAPYIYAAFMGTYRMNLQRIKSKNLHWWEFVALFDALPDDCKIRKIMYWRTCDTSGLPRKEIQRINELRKRYELKDDVSMEAKVSLAQRDQRMKDYVAKRFREVENHGEKQQHRD